MGNKRGEETRRKICKVLEKGKMMQTDIAKELGMSKGTVNHQMLILEKEDKVEIVQKFGYIKIYGLKKK
jgi:predicted ArsR family transcriptional regulator